MNCVIYARVSSKEQEKEGFSIPAQLKLLKEYAAKSGFGISGEFIDVETAKRTGRVNFEKMVTFLRSNPATKAILVEKTDRLYRNFRDYVTLEELNAEIHLVKENEIIGKNSHSHAKFIHGIKVLMAKNYIDNLSEEVRKGMLEKASQGEWPSRAPVGYCNNRETHLIEPDPEKGPFIKKLFEWYASGSYSLERLSEMAKESGLFSRNSMTINKAGIHRILKNPVYYGEFVWKGKRYVGRHIPILSKALFHQVQEVFAQANRPKESKRNLAFAGLVRCTKCGCAMTPEIKKGIYVYYHCTQFKGKCDNVYVREEKLADLMADAVKRIRIDQEMVDFIKAAILESQKDKIKFQTDSLGSLRKKHDHIQRLLDKAYEDKLSGQISPEMWLRKKSEWEDNLIDLQIQIKAYESASLDYYKVGSQILELAKSAYSLYLKQDRSEQRKLLNTILSNCTFYRGTLYPTYRKPFDIFAKGSEFESMRPRPHSPQTLVSFDFRVRLHYVVIAGTRWKTIAYDATTCRNWR